MISFLWYIYVMNQFSRTDRLISAKCDMDFDHEFILYEKYDTKYSYKNQ